MTITKNSTIKEVKGYKIELALKNRIAYSRFMQAKEGSKEQYQAMVEFRATEQALRDFDHVFG